MKKIILATLAFTFSLSLFAQEFEEVVVTGSMLDGNYYEMPAVTIKKKADFLVQRIRLVNDSRSPGLRRSEIRKTISNLIDSSRKVKGIALSYGEGFLVPVNLNDDSLEIIEDRKKSDTSYVNIYAKVAVNADNDAKDQINELRSFVYSARLDGRTEIETQGDVGLSIVSPEQYRYEILGKIAEENNKITEVVGGTCKITVAGLEGRVEWERSDISELTLYIPYATEITC
ncbi:hypothetical protein [Microbulbifer discodermiae]|uniref:hypothetical protein n=1 Tax=Microbulbifer sp. 2201CG32-9 TaxID=3232309 RepID=UPI00345C1D56